MKNNKSSLWKSVKIFIIIIVNIFGLFLILNLKSFANQNLLNIPNNKYIPTLNPIIKYVAIVLGFILLLFILYVFITSSKNKSNVTNKEDESKENKRENKERAVIESIKDEEIIKKNIEFLANVQKDLKRESDRK